MTENIVVLALILLHVTISGSTHRRCSSACLDPPNIRALRRADLAASGHNSTRHLCQSGGTPPSRCKWNYEINFRSDRVPQYIPTAVCETCAHCRRSSSTSECVKIFYKVPVFIREGNDCREDGYYKYKRDFHSVIVGCTCEEPDRTGNNRTHPPE